LSPIKDIRAPLQIIRSTLGREHFVPHLYPLRHAKPLLQWIIVFDRALGMDRQATSLALVATVCCVATAVLVLVKKRREVAPGTSHNKVLVTGGNSGIGLALCKQLVIDHGCHVFMGSRSLKRGQAAVKSIKIPKNCKGSLNLIQIDVGNVGSINAAVTTIRASIGTEKLYAVVNNAGIGLSAKASREEVINTNLFGPKRVCEAFGPLLSPTKGRIVNVGSGAGPKYVNRCPKDVQVLMSSEPESWEQIESWIATSADGKSGIKSKADNRKGYGLSKALLASYTMLLAKEHPEWLSSCCAPGFIDTKLVAGFGATKPPAEGTPAMKHCLFGELQGNGWYYGSDAVRSQLHVMRNPGEPPYDGAAPS
jgi:NAD(P)-dependent dehydrogenase (short-subunit alcohol dehydrogenase family)